MNSELQVAGGGECPTTTMDLQATSEAAAMNSKLAGLQATSEGLSVKAGKAASQVTVATAEGVDEPPQQPARQSRGAGAGEQAMPPELEEDFVAFLCSECGVCGRCEACSQLESLFECGLERVRDSDCGFTAMLRQALE